MKKTLIAITLLVALGFSPTKSLKVEADLNEWNKHINKLEIIRAIADESNLSNQQVKFITKTIDSIEMFIVPQLRKQLADTINKK